MSFKIGPIFHLIHMSDDFWELNDWYAEIFAPIEFTKRHSDGNTFPTWTGEMRDASLIVVADVCFEPMSPSMFLDGWDKMPVGRFYNKFGRHWHSIAWYTDDNLELYRSLKDRGVRFFFNGGGSDSSREPTPGEALFTHPKDTAGALELMQGPRINDDVVRDPRFTSDYDVDRWAREHPLGLKRLAYITLVVKDLDKAKKFYVEGLNGTVLLEDDSSLTMTRSTFVAVGDHTIVELALPLESDTLAGRDLARNGDIMHSVAFQVVDLDQAERYLTSKGVGIVGCDDSTLLADPDTTFGAPFRFTTASLPGDPRDNPAGG
jgi:catechol 2,3-dioxygenase-like lactoylglutathione lyase family enzyme